MFLHTVMHCICVPGLETSKYSTTSATMVFKVADTEIPFRNQGYYFPYNLSNRSSHKQKSQLFSEKIKLQAWSIQGQDCNNRNKLYHVVLLRLITKTYLPSENGSPNIPAQSFKIKTKGILISCRASAWGSFKLLMSASLSYFPIWQGSLFKQSNKPNNYVFLFSASNCTVKVQLLNHHQP